MEEGRIGGGRKSMSHAAKDSHACQRKNPRVGGILVPGT